MYVYCIENLVNGKKYVGQTTKTIEERFEKHVKTALTGSSNSIHKAIRKYGRDQFKCNLLDTANTYDELLEREVFWINQLDTRNTGYNETLGGEGSAGRILSEETRQKIRESNKEHFSDPENRKKTSDATREGMKKWKDSLTPEQWEEFKRVSGNSTRGKKFPGKGRGIKRSKEFGEKVSKRLKGVPKSRESIEKGRLKKLGRHTGKDNPMANPEHRAKIAEKARNRKKVVRPDGTWFWGRKGD